MRLLISGSILILAILLNGVVFAEESPLSERPYFDFYAESAHFLPVVDSAISSARAELEVVLGDTLGYKPSVYIESSLERFRERIGSMVPDWGAAVAIPFRGQIIIKSPANFRLGKSLYELTKHEYAHLALAERFGMVRPPRWLDEGLAMYTAFEWSWSNSFALSRAVTFGGLLSLEEIEGINRLDQNRAETAYAQSYLAVKYLLDTYGVEALNILIDSLSRKAPIESAMMAATGSDRDGFEQEYLNFLKGRYNLLTLFIDMSYLWLFLAIVVVIGFVLRYRRKKKAYEQWDEEEKLQSTDFDYGDPDNPEEIEDEDKPWS